LTFLWTGVSFLVIGFTFGPPFEGQTTKPPALPGVREISQVENKNHHHHPPPDAAPLGNPCHDPRVF
jgi:hypothetical protein